MNKVRRARKGATTDAMEILDQVFLKGQPDEAAQREQLQVELDNCDIARQLCDLRAAAGLSQRDLAKLVGTSHSAIARLEDADYRGHSLSMLRRIAEVLDASVRVTIVSRKHRRAGRVASAAQR